MPTLPHNPNFCYRISLISNNSLVIGNETFGFAVIKVKIKKKVECKNVDSNENTETLELSLLWEKFAIDLPEVYPTMLWIFQRHRNIKKSCISQYYLTINPNLILPYRISVISNN